MERQPWRVCRVVTRLVVGGAPEHTIEASARLDPAEYETRLIAGAEGEFDETLIPEVRRRGIDLRIMPSIVGRISPADDLRALRGLRREFRRYQPHIVHTHSSKAGALGRVAAWLERVPVIVHTVHGWSFHDELGGPSRRTYIQIERACARVSAKLVVVGAPLMQEGLAEGIGRPSDYELIPSGIELSRWREAPKLRRSARAELGIPPQAPVVGVVARLCDQKDPLAFVDAARRISAERPDAWYVMIGDGPLREATEKRVVKHGVADRFVFTGMRRDAAELVAAFDVFMLTSLWEGLPKVVPQAMAAGVPVIASDVGAVSEAIDHGRTGFLVKPRDIAGYSHTACRLLADATRARSMAEAASPVAESYGVETTIAGLERLYRPLVETLVHNGAGPPSRIDRPVISWPQRLPSAGRE